jgi:hypothetical protein
MTVTRLKDLSTGVALSTIAGSTYSGAAGAQNATSWSGSSNTISALLTQAGTRSGQQIITSGFWAPRLGAGGLWAWDSASTATHDYATVVKPTDTSGAGRWHKQFVGPMSVKDFGAIGDGTSRPLSTYFATLGEAQAIYPHATALTDEVDWAGIQAAVNWHTNAASPTNQRAGSLLLDGCFNINKTVTISQKGIVFQGLGWGVTYAPDKGSYLRWTGSAGSPMALVDEGWGTWFKDIRFIGKSSAKPSAAIQYNSDFSLNGVLINCGLDNVWIGSQYGYDVDDEIQFDVGIDFPAGLQGDSMDFRHVVIIKCTTGIKCYNEQASFLHHGLYIYYCTVGIETQVLHRIAYGFFANNTLDLSLNTGAKIYLNSIGSEAATKFCEINGPLVTVHAVGFAVNIIGGKYNNDGVIVDTKNNYSWNIHLENMEIYYSGYSGTDANIKTRTAGQLSSGRLTVLNCQGLWLNGLDVGPPVWSNDYSFLEYSPMSSSTQDPLPSSKLILNYRRADNRTVQYPRNDFAGKMNIFGGDLVVDSLGTPPVVTATATGGSGTTYSYRVSALTLDGETLASTAATCSGGATLSGSVYNDITWHPMVGARGYKIYGRASGSEQLLKTLTFTDFHARGVSSFHTWRDTGALSPSGALPTIDTTGRIVAENGYCFDTAAGVSMRSGSGAPTHTAPNGSMWYRTDGSSTNDNLYIRRGGAWVGIA